MDGKERRTLKTLRIQGGSGWVGLVWLNGFWMLELLRK